jgi:hypothetical protein
MDSSLDSGIKGKNINLMDNNNNMGAVSGNQQVYHNI